MTTVDMTVKWCLDNHIDYLSVFVFSAENFKRGKKDVFFDLLCKALSKFTAPKDVSVETLSCHGYFDMLPDALKDALTSVATPPTQETRLRVQLLVGYGGTQEMDDARTHGTPLLTAHLPDVDAVLRTGHVQRLSNFMLYKCAYAELFFETCLFPELTRQHLDGMKDTYATIHRRFGT